MLTQRAHDAYAAELEHLAATYAAELRATQRAKAAASLVALLGARVRAARTRAFARWLRAALLPISQVMKWNGMIGTE